MYITGKTYQLIQPPPNGWTSTSLSGKPSGSGTGGLLNRQEIGPFVSSVDLMIDRVGFNVTSAHASGTATVVIFNSDEFGRPSSLLAQAPAIPLISTGFVDGAIPETLLEKHKLYWIGHWRLVVGGNIRMTSAVKPWLVMKPPTTTPYSLLRRTVAPLTGGVSPDWIYSDSQEIATTAPPWIALRTKL